jgi:hypothetical protein
MWFGIIYVLTYIEEILFLKISVSHYCQDLSLRKTSWEMQDVLLSFFLCIWKFLKEFIFNTWILGEVQLHSLVRMILLSWEDICDISILNVKVKYTMNIIRMSPYVYPWDTHCLSVRTHTKNQTLDRNVSKVFMFPPNICQIGRNVREHKISSNVLLKFSSSMAN